MKFAGNTNKKETKMDIKASTEYEMIAMEQCKALMTLASVLQRPSKITLHGEDYTRIVHCLAKLGHTPDSSIVLGMEITERKL